MHGQKSENMYFFPRFVRGYSRSFSFKEKHPHRFSNRNLLLNIFVKTYAFVQILYLYMHVGIHFFFLFLFSVSNKIVLTFSLQLVLTAQIKPGSSPNDWKRIDLWHCWRHIWLTGSLRDSRSQSIRFFVGLWSVG